MTKYDHSILTILLIIFSFLLANHAVANLGQSEYGQTLAGFHRADKGTFRDLQ